MTKKHLTLSKKDIREWVDSRSFTRGMAYFENDAVYNKHKQGNTLSAKCGGSQEWDYELRNEGKLDMALDQAEKIFWQRPDVSDYFEIIRLAQIQGNKKTIRSRILETLFQKTNFRLLTMIYVNENEIDQAIMSLNLFKAKEKHWRSLELEYLVAQAAASVKPYESILIYMEIINSLIDQRGRGNYHQASQYLVEVRKICRQIKDSSKWDNLIKNLRSKHQRLPAFQDELNRAGL